MRYELRPVGVFDRDLGRQIKLGDVEWPTYDAWLAAGNVPDPVPKPPKVTLEYAIAEKLAKIEEKAAQQRQRTTYPASSQEMSSWAEKLRQARAFATSQLDADAPMLAREAVARGVTTADIARRIVSNYNAFSQAEAQIAGVSGFHRDAVRALVDVDAVMAYDFSPGWPFMPPPTPP
ncbi:MAG TPA: hypothetical protein VLH12_08625 [Usitatibacter sp.]|nr:hypothetical protein [Usitatibacter sp.]